MTVEEIELRKILTQMLADNGINRNTILDITKDIIREKVDRAVKQATHEVDIDGIVTSVVKAEARRELRDTILNRVRNRMSSMEIVVTVKSEEDSKIGIDAIKLGEEK